MTFSMKDFGLGTDTKWSITGLRSWVGSVLAGRSLSMVPRGPCDTHVPLEPFLGGVHNNLPCVDLWEIGGRLLGKVTGKGVGVYT